MLPMYGVPGNRENGQDWKEVMAQKLPGEATAETDWLGESPLVGMRLLISSLSGVITADGLCSSPRGSTCILPLRKEINPGVVRGAPLLPAAAAAYRRPLQAPSGLEELLAGSTSARSLSVTKAPLSRSSSQPARRTATTPWGGHSTTCPGGEDSLPSLQSPGPRKPPKG
ncbi:unnamed protein product [Gadus morhua 'NCC']